MWVKTKKQKHQFDAKKILMRLLGEKRAISKHQGTSNLATPPVSVVSLIRRNQIFGFYIAPQHNLVEGKRHI